MILIKKIKRKVKNIALFKIGKFIRFLKKPSLPKNPDGTVLIHIGCGELNDSRYINVDVRPGWHIHFLGSMEDCEKLFPLNYADLIYICHVLEHISHLKISQAIQGLYKTLKKGGTLRISVPDFDTIMEMYKEKKSIKDIMAPLMGGQGYSANFHHSVFNEDYLRQLLLKSGFGEVRKWNPENAQYYNFDDWSKRKINLYGKDWPISLNIEAIK